MENRWTVFFLILPFLNIYYFKLEDIKPIILLCQLIVIILALVIIFKNLNIFIILLICLMSIVLFSSAINHTLSFGIIFSILGLISLCIYISYLILNYPSELLKGLFYLCGTVLVINFTTLLLPDGIATSWNGYPIFFLGGKNSVQLTTIMCIGIIAVYSYYFHQKLKILYFSLIIIGIISMFLSQSGTGIVLSLLLLSYLFVRIPVTLNRFLLFYLILFFSIVIFRAHEVLFGDFLINYLHKDLTFTGRTLIWDYVLDILPNSWLLGFGRGSSLISNSFDNLYETHNGVLEILMSSGYLGIIFFTLIIFMIGNKLDKSKNDISKALTMTIMGLLILGLTESIFFKNEFWIILTMSYGVNNFINKSKEFL
ncbi:hypothetical protein P4S88_12340 [Anoxybacillus geothermalis]|nr:hypothetical protein [Anoxybacillus geothermalis]